MTSEKTHHTNTHHSLQTLTMASSLSLTFLTLLLIFSAAASQYLKLPLHRHTPFPSPHQSLISDTNRLSLLLRRRGHKSSTKSPVISGASSGSGQYFVSLHLGSPPQQLLLVADTGSDLIWVKCSACRTCSNHSPPKSFLARHSSTFKPLHCFDTSCDQVPHPVKNPCNHTQLHSPCRYEYSYSDGSITSGFFSTESTALNTTMGKLKILKKLAFGCSFKASGPSVTGASFNGAQGVMGLGRGPISFATQIGHRFGRKFSYCLKDYTLSPAPTSFLTIGENQNNIVWTNTPLLFNPLSPTFYYIGIKNVYVNGIKLKINPQIWSIDELGNGGTIMDSGTTLTFLVEPAYKAILSAMQPRIKLPTPDQPTLGFDLCVNVTGVEKPKFPRLSFELAGDSPVFSPPARNYFIQTSEGVKCLAVQPVNSGTGISVIGNLMQQGFLFEFDRDRSRLGFSRKGCGLP